MSSIKAPSASSSGQAIRYVACRLDASRSTRRRSADLTCCSSTWLIWAKALSELGARTFKYRLFLTARGVTSVRANR